MRSVPAETGLAEYTMVFLSGETVKLAPLPAVSNGVTVSDFLVANLKNLISRVVGRFSSGRPT
jgi:hypothetical protein